MSKQKPYTAKSSSLPVVETCSGCKFWREHGEYGPGEEARLTRKGLCTAVPPSVSRGVVDGIGPVMTYGYTAANEIACGMAEAK